MKYKLNSKPGIIMLFLTVFSLLWSCANEDDSPIKKGRIQVSLSPQISEQARATESLEPAGIRISIRDASGEMIESQTYLELHSFGTGYVTESLIFLVGNYSVTEFLVLNEDGDVIYATPIEFSERASDVTDPLPVEFTINEEENLPLILQVVAVDETSTPESFGYVYFGFDIIDTPTQPDSIEITYVATLNPVYETEGLDSVVVRFSKRTETKIFDVSLSISSPIEAKWKVALRALDLGETPFWPDWQITVRAYYEVIDTELANSHINELIVELPTIPIRHETTHIHIQNDGLSLASANDTYASYPESQIGISNYAHVIDSEFDYHLIMNNDLCDPVLKYSILHSNDFIYLEKGVYPDRYSFIERYEAIPQLWYTDTFAEMCEGVEEEDKAGYIYLMTMRIVGNDVIFKEAFIDWFKNHEPVIYPLSSAQSSDQNGGFKVYSAGQNDRIADIKNTKQAELLNKLKSKVIGSRK